MEQNGLRYSSDNITLCHVPKSGIPFSLDTLIRLFRNSELRNIKLSESFLPAQTKECHQTIGKMDFGKVCFGVLFALANYQLSQNNEAKWTSTNDFHLKVVLFDTDYSNGLIVISRVSIQQINSGLHLPTLFIFSVPIQSNLPALQITLIKFPHQLPF